MSWINREWRLSGHVRPNGGMLQLTAFCYFAFDLKIDGELRELYGGEPRTTWEPRVETSRESMSRDQIIYHHS